MVGHCFYLFDEHRGEKTRTWTGSYFQVASLLSCASCIYCTVTFWHLRHYINMSVEFFLSHRMAVDHHLFHPAELSHPFILLQTLLQTL